MQLMRRVAVAALLAALAAPASAQQQSDPRLAGPMIGALQAVVALREAEAKAIADDAAKRIAELEKLCGEPCTRKAKPAAK
jgi:hypothetical protein